MRFRCRETDALIDDVRVKRSALQKMLGLRFVRDGRAWFPFQSETQAAIDMTGVRFPLDIAFLSRDGTVREVVQAEPVGLHPSTWQTYRAEKPFHSVLEVEQGLLAQLGIEEGCRLEPVQSPEAHSTSRS